ncbi:MAG: hypothetical protein WAK84_09845 [Candidatus Cybelea sp.]
MPFTDRLASRAVYGGATPRIIALGSLRRERLTRGFDRALAMLASCSGHARVAMPAPALKHRLTAHLARALRSTSGAQLRVQ